jgi:hypothetical protein
MTRTIIAGLLILGGASCTSWRPLPVQPATYINEHKPDSLWVQLQDGAVCVLTRPSVVLDTLTGIDAGAYRHIPLKNVAQLRTQERSVGKTTLLITTIAVLSAATIYFGLNSDNTTP